MNTKTYACLTHSCLLISIFLCGCSGLTRQYHATSEGMSLDYVVQKEQEIVLKQPINVTLHDDRSNKDFIGDGAKSTVGDKFLGYFAFGVLYATAPDSPTLKNKEDPATVFKTAIIKRLNNVGVSTLDDVSTKIVLDITVKRFELDFSFGIWISEAAYTASFKKDGQVFCRKEIAEKSKHFNLYGYGSGEETANDAFNKSINALDLKECLSRVS